jgi:pimeloyl-ACP methyl ester carboxylesterase
LPAVTDRLDPTGLHVVERPGADPDSPLVVLVHGVLDQHTSFNGAAERLGDLRVVTYDRRGWGASLDATPAAPTLEAHADDLLAILDGRRATVVGHSIGANVAMVAAYRRPDLVASVALFEPHAPWLEGWPEEVQANVLAIGSDPDPEAVAETAYLRIYGEDRWATLAQEVRRARRAEGAAYQVDLGTGWQTEFAFARATVPTVVACAERSVAFFVDACRRLAADLPGVYVEIPGARHSAHVSHPDQFAALVRTTVAAAEQARTG